jgi:hypothetical protein
MLTSLEKEEPSVQSSTEKFLEGPSLSSGTEGFLKELFFELVANGRFGWAVVIGNAFR